MAWEALIRDLRSRSEETRQRTGVSDALALTAADALEAGTWTPEPARVLVNPLDSARRDTAIRLAAIDEVEDLLVQRDCFTERTLDLIRELRDAQRCGHGSYAADGDTRVCLVCGDTSAVSDPQRRNGE